MAQEVDASSGDKEDWVKLSKPDETPEDSKNVTQVEGNKYRVTVPDGIEGGEFFRVTIKGQSLKVKCPLKARAGSKIRVTLPTRQAAPADDANSKNVLEIAKDHPGPYFTRVPPYTKPGEYFKLTYNGAYLRVKIPAGATKGQRLWYMLGQSPNPSAVDGNLGPAPPPPTQIWTFPRYRRDEDEKPAEEKDPDRQFAFPERDPRQREQPADTDSEDDSEFRPSLRPDTLRGMSFDSSHDGSAPQGERRAGRRRPSTDGGEDDSSDDESRDLPMVPGSRPSMLRGMSFEDDPNQTERRAGRRPSGEEGADWSDDESRDLPMVPGRRPQMMRGRSFEDDEAAAGGEEGVSNMRPQTVRGHSFEQDDRDLQPRAPRRGRRPDGSADSEDDDDEDEHGVNSMRPQTLRGMSFESDDRNQFESQEESGPNFRRGRRPAPPPQAPPHEDEEVDLRHVGHLEKKIYEWERPGWTEADLKPTGKGNAIKQGASLALPAMRAGELLEKNISKTVPEWANKALRPTGKGDAIKQGESLAVPATHVDIVAERRNIHWERPEWTLKSPLKKNTRFNDSASGLALPFNESFRSIGEVSAKPLGEGEELLDELYDVEYDESTGRDDDPALYEDALLEKFEELSQEDELLIEDEEISLEDSDDESFIEEVIVEEPIAA